MKQVFDESFGIIPVLIKEEKIYLFLVCHKKDAFWGFPKGHKEEGEDSLEAAKRELFEETGLQVLNFLSSDAFIERYTFFHQEQEVHKKVLYYLASTTEDFVVDQKEILEGKWVLLEEAETLATYKEGKKLCLEVARCLKKR